MAKRQIDTSIIQQNWYMELNSRARNLWWHLFLSCDNIGVFEVNTRLIGVYTGEKFSKQEIFSLFGGRVAPVPNHPEKGIIVDFVKFQSRGGVGGNAPWQRAMRSRMSELGIDEEWLSGVSSTKTHGVEQCDEVAEPEEVAEDSKEDGIDYEAAFSRFWDAYPSECPRKVDKKKCFAEFVRIMRDASDPNTILDEVMEGLAVWKRCETWVRDGGKYIRAPLAWLNGECWNDRPTEVKDECEDDRGFSRKSTNWRKPKISDSESSLL